MQLISIHNQKVGKIICRVLWIVALVHLLYALGNLTPPINILRTLVIIVSNLICLGLRKYNHKNVLPKYIPSITMMILAVTYNTFTEMTIFCMVGPILVQ